MRSAGWWICAGLCLAIQGCDDNTPLCVPKTTAACFCYTGDPGQRVCSDDGLKYTSCSCLPAVAVDANPGVDADTDADSSSDVAAAPEVDDTPSGDVSPPR
jgi:hypothetical protein